VTLVAGNHEGRSRGVAVLGETVESVERDGWTLVHGDDSAGTSGRRIVGHLHPSLPLAGNQSIPVFLLAPSLIVVPALTPYSRGLSVLSDACARAIEAFDAHARATVVVASGPDLVYPFGRLSSLRGALRGRPAGALARPYRYRRRSR
jgi:metallophosphoesterase superfamily enzyme